MAVGTLTEQAAEDVIVVTARRIDGKAIGFFGIGLGVGIAIGLYVGYKYSKKKLRADIMGEAEKEIAEVREHYRQKIIADAAQEKPTVSEIVREKGYSDKDIETEPERPTRPPVPVSPPTPYHSYIPFNTGFNPSIMDFRTDAASKDKNEDWNYVAELAERNNGEPFILHQDEYELNEPENQQTAYIYFSEDNCLVDSDDPQTILKNVGNLIGFKALTHFGHGSDDYNVVYVRNPTLQLDFEIFRTKGSWEKEVLGLEEDDSN